MLRLALHGGLFSGKSTLAHALVERSGFHYVNYTDMIKTFAVAALATVGIETTVEEIHANKERYRPFIIELATLLDFDHGYGIEEICRLLDEQGIDRVVFDNVRFAAQYAKLRPHGFRLVRITTPWNTRAARAEAAGLDYNDFVTRTLQPTEEPLDYYPEEVEVSVDGPIEKVIDKLTAKLAQAQLHERRTAELRRAILERQPVVERGA
jgi:hypothetical protein